MLEDLVGQEEKFDIMDEEREKRREAKIKLKEALSDESKFWSQGHRRCGLSKAIYA